MTHTTRFFDNYFSFINCQLFFLYKQKLCTFYWYC